MPIVNHPWPWYIAGPLIGLVVPLLLVLGNRSFGISSTLRHICAACIPANIPFFNYDWKKERWNLVFVLGIAAGGFIATTFLSNGGSVPVSPSTVQVLKQEGIRDFSGLLPSDIFSFSALLTVKGLLFMVVGGFLVGFGTRYAGGCTSGHSIMGIASLQWPSLVATCCFMAGGFFMTWVLMPLLFKWL